MFAGLTVSDAVVPPDVAVVDVDGRSAEGCFVQEPRAPAVATTIKQTASHRTPS